MTAPTIPPHRLAWLPIPGFLVAIVVLWVVGPEAPRESLGLAIALNLVFSVMTSLVVAHLIGRTFLARGAPGMLLLGCGIVIWGLAGVVGSAAALAGAPPVAIHNSCVFLAAVCHLAAAALLLKDRPGLRRGGTWLVAGYALALGAVAIVALAGLKGWLPTFFIPGQGGTPLRHVVLGSSIAMFLVAARLLRKAIPASRSPFSFWYALALGLIAVGLFGVMIQPVRGSLLGWVGRSAQFLSGVYMLVAAIASVRETGAWRLPLEAALRDSEERLQAVLDSAVDMLYRRDLRTGRFDYVSPSAEKVVGYTPEEIAAMSTAEALSLVHPDDVPAFRDALARLDASGKAEAEYRQRAPDGTYRWLSSRMTCTRDGAGTPLYRNGSIRDITERKRAEEELRQGRARLETILASMTDARYVLDSQWRLVDINPRCEAFFGRTRAELVGRNIWELYPETAGSRTYEELHRAKATGQPVHFESIPRPGQKCFDVHAYPEPEEMAVYLRDITERKQAEEALRQRNQELEEFNQAMVGRELRMIELKREINAVCAQFGQRPRYPMDEEVAQS